MKKIIFISIVASITILTGCSLTGNEKMKCTATDTVGNVTTDKTFEVEYKGNDVKKVKLTYDYNLDNTELTVKTDNNTTNDDITNDNTNNTTNNATKDMDESDEIAGGIIGDTIEDLIDSVADVATDIVSLKKNHENLQGVYNNTTGFTTKVDYDDDNHYKVIYEIDYDKISDTDLSNLGLDRSLDVVKENYLTQGLSCQ